MAEPQLALPKFPREHDGVCRGALIGALLWRPRAGRRFHAKPVREISHPRDDPGGDSEQTNGGAVAAFRSTGAAELRSEPLRASTAPSQRRPRAVSVRRQNSSAAPQAVPGVQRSAVQERRPAVMIDCNTTVAARRALVDLTPELLAFASCNGGLDIGTAAHSPNRSSRRSREWHYRNLCWSTMLFVEES